MQFTRAEGYGLLGVIYLANQDQDQVIPLSEIATAEDVPEKFLAKIFQNLTKTGIVRSHRGVKGGFSLNRSPDEITVRAVVEAIQGPYHIIRCLNDNDNDCCQKTENCPLRDVLAEAEEKLLGVFSSYTIADLQNWKSKVRSRKS
nr:Rrf2 family transcriptional regulator [candidate division Zixibacteria bacterium]